MTPIVYSHELNNLNAFETNESIRVQALAKPVVHWIVAMLFAIDRAIPEDHRNTNNSIPSLTNTFEVKHGSDPR